MSFTEQEIAELRAARTSLLLNKAKGVETIKKGDEQITFRSVSEIDAILADIGAAVDGPKRMQHYPTFVARPR